MGIINLHDQMYNTFYCLITKYGLNRNSMFQETEWIFQMNQVLKVPSGPTDGTFQLVLIGFWACLLYCVLFRILHLWRQPRNQSILTTKSNVSSITWRELWCFWLWSMRMLVSLQLLGWNCRFSRASRSLSSCRRWYLRFLNVSNAAYTKYSIKCHYKLMIKCEIYQDFIVSCNR